MDERTVYYDMDGKKLEHVVGDFHFWPSPHTRLHGLRSEPIPSTPYAYRCEECGAVFRTRIDGDFLIIEGENSTNCREYEPCDSCGLRGICATDCGGLLAVLESPAVYVAGQPVDERPS